VCRTPSPRVVHLAPGPELELAATGAPRDERNDEAVHQWVKKRWPHLKKGTAPERADRFEDESGVSLLPSV
jgi:hypothetical protein